MKRKNQHERTTPVGRAGDGVASQEELLALKTLPCSAHAPITQIFQRFQRALPASLLLDAHLVELGFGQIDSNFEVNLVRLKCLYELAEPPVP